MVRGKNSEMYVFRTPRDVLTKPRECMRSQRYRDFQWHSYRRRRWRAGDMTLYQHGTFSKPAKLESKVYDYNHARSSGIQFNRNCTISKIEMHYTAMSLTSVMNEARIQRNSQSILRRLIYSTRIIRAMQWKTSYLIHCSYHVKTSVKTQQLANITDACQNSRIYERPQSIHSQHPLLCSR